MYVDGGQTDRQTPIIRSAERPAGPPTMAQTSVDVSPKSNAKAFSKPASRSIQRGAAWRPAPPPTHPPPRDSRIVPAVAATEEKRRLILDAAVRVFARQGFHESRVGDIAKDAGVAYGLVYHYFASKDAVLEAVFREAWGRLLAAIREVEDSDEPAPDQLRTVTKIVLRTWRDDPDLVRLLVRQVTRSPHLQREIDEIAGAFAALERIVARGQEEGSLRPDLDARLAAWMLYGALEEILTGWVLGQLPDGADGIAAAERSVTETLLRGFLPG
jgi:TetR/AcrR family fatty acid metabolism transcriptional regulator